MNSPSLTVVDTAVLERLISGIDKLLSSTSAPEPDELEDLVTHETAAQILGLSPFTLYTHSSRGRIKCYRRGKRNYYSRKVLAEWIKNGGSVVK